MNSSEKIMKSRSENKQIFLKSLFFVLSFYILANSIIFLWSIEWISGSTVLFCLLGVLLIATPLYFFLKSDVKNCMRYLGNMAIVHGIFYAVEFLIVCLLGVAEFFNGWDVFAWLVSSVIPLSGIGIILLIDLIYNLYVCISKCRK